MASKEMLRAAELEAAELAKRLDAMQTSAQTRHGFKGPKDLRRGVEGAAHRGEARTAQGLLVKGALPSGHWA